MRILLLGAPGSGKGTQAKLLAKALNAKHLSSGDLFRHNPGLSKEERSEMAKGNLLSRERVLELVKNELDGCESYILDGYPRTLDQAKDLDALLSTDEPLTVIYLNVSDEEVTKRLSGRLTCPNCGAIYHKVNKPPQRAGICSECGTELLVRPDDQIDSIKKRLNVYHEQTEPLIEYYKSKNLLKEIKGENLSPAEISSEILKCVQPSS